MAVVVMFPSLFSFNLPSFSVVHVDDGRSKPILAHDLQEDEQEHRGRYREANDGKERTWRIEVNVQQTRMRKGGARGEAEGRER